MHGENLKCSTAQGLAQTLDLDRHVSVFFSNGRRDELASERESFSLVFEAEILPLPMAPSVLAGTLQRRSWSLSADLEL